MHLFVILLFLCGCDSTTKDTDTTDTGSADSSDGLPGLDTDDWVMASAAPTDGEALHYYNVIGGWEGETTEAHWTELYTRASDGAVLCAYSFFFTGDARASDSGCDSAWTGDFSLPGGYGASYCVEVLGYDPLGKGINHITGLGYSTDGTLCLEEAGDGWEASDGLSYASVDGGFMLTYSEAFTYEE